MLMVSNWQYFTTRINVSSQQVSLSVLIHFFPTKKWKKYSEDSAMNQKSTPKKKFTCQNTSPHCTICSTCQTGALRFAYSNSQIHIFTSSFLCDFVGDCTLSLKHIHMSELQVCDSIPATHLSRHINSITQVSLSILVNLFVHIKPGLSTTVNGGLSLYY